MSKHNNLIIDAHNARMTITDTEARRIASEWHGGGGTALYAFASTGAIDTARADHNVRGEIGTNLIWLTGVFHPMNQPYDDQPVTREGFTDYDLHELVALRAYIEHHQNRGPIEGWSDLTW